MEDAGLREVHRVADEASQNAVLDQRETLECGRRCIVVRRAQNVGQRAEIKVIGEGVVAAIAPVARRRGRRVLRHIVVEVTRRRHRGHVGSRLRVADGVLIHHFSDDAARDVEGGVAAPADLEPIILE